MPKIILGLRLKALMNLSFHLLDMEAYSVSPFSPVRLINTLPVRLWRVIKSEAVSRCFKLWILLRQDVVRGIDHSFFLAGARSFHIQREILFLIRIFLIDRYSLSQEYFSGI